MNYQLYSKAIKNIKMKLRARYNNGFIPNIYIVPKTRLNMDRRVAVCENVGLSEMGLKNNKYEGFLRKYSTELVCIVCLRIQQRINCP